MSQLASNPIRPASPLTAEDLEGDLIQSGHPLFGIVWVNPERLSGEPCFAGTRVPVKVLFDYLEGGEPLEEFLEGFPPVTREQAVAVLELSRSTFIDGLTPR
ncbi:MAG TPA: DUF433 domain-containing protein [Tepidisphaeraceae bacterium]|jgi:uncharacterized protein (DUF433 family)